jgi:AmiR/NasT family two-component response regulator
LPADIDAFISSGANVVVIKPITKQKLLDVLKSSAVRNKRASSLDASSSSLKEHLI